MRNPIATAAPASAQAPERGFENLKTYCSGDAVTFCSGKAPDSPEMDACFRTNMTRSEVLPACDHGLQGRKRQVVFAPYSPDETCDFGRDIMKATEDGYEPSNPTGTSISGLGAGRFCKMAAPVAERCVWAEVTPANRW
jgi:hypothetical protein